MPAGSSRRVPGVSSGALYRRSAPRTRSLVAARTRPGRVAVAARAGVADPAPYRTTGRAARPPRTPRRLRVPPPAPSARSASACCRWPPMMFTHVPLSSPSLVMAHGHASGGASYPYSPGPVSPVGHLAGTRATGPGVHGFDRTARTRPWKRSARDWDLAAPASRPRAERNTTVRSERLKFFSTERSWFHFHGPGGADHGVPRHDDHPRPGRDAGPGRRRRPGPGGRTLARTGGGGAPAAPVAPAAAAG